MDRRHVLVGAASALTAIAGCSSGDSGGSGGKASDTIAGKLYKSPNFKGHDVAGVANSDNTLTIRGTLENVSETDRVVTGFYLKFYDDGEEVLLTASSQLDSPMTIAAGASDDAELTTDNMGHSAASSVAAFEAMVSSHEA